MNELEGHIDLAQAAEHQRQALARRIGAHLKLSENEADRRAALEIARVLAVDFSVAVRSALMQEVMSVEFLPAPLLDTLIRDIHEISLPFVAACPAIDNDRLLALIDADDPAYHEAVAKRRELPEPVSFAICEQCGEDAVEALMANDSAEISHRVCSIVLDRFGDAESLMITMSRRGDLPVDAIEPLLERLSQTAATALVQRTGLAPDFAAYLTESARRRVLGSTLETAPRDRIADYMVRLHGNGELTADILLHLVRNGNVNSFLVGVGVFCGSDHGELDLKLSKGGPAHLRALLSGADLSRPNVDLMVDAYETAIAMQRDASAET